MLQSPNDAKRSYGRSAAVRFGADGFCWELVIGADGGQVTGSEQGAAANEHFHY